MNNSISASTETFPPLTDLCSIKDKCFVPLPTGYPKKFPDYSLFTSSYQWKHTHPPIRVILCVVRQTYKEPSRPYFNDCSWIRVCCCNFTIIISEIIFLVFICPNPNNTGESIFAWTLHLFGCIFSNRKFLNPLGEI